MSFIDLNYRPSSSDLVCRFFVEPSPGSSIESACEDIAAESSIGTWTDISTMDSGIGEKLGPHVFEIDKGMVSIAYPSDLFEAENMPCILSSVAGNIFGMKAVENLRLVDVFFPKKLARSFPGPEFGIYGVRGLLGVRKRPLVGTIIKPKLGLPSGRHAEVAYESWVGGCDIVKDDENLTSQRFNPFEERVLKTLEARDRAEEESGEGKVYMPNVSSETGEMLRRAEFVRDHGGRYVMVDIVTVGFSGLQALIKADLGLVIHGHRAMHAAFTRNKKHGISMLVLAKLSRLVGVDQLHIGTGVGKMEGPRQEVLGIRDAIVGSFFDLKPVFPVSSGGLHPGLVPPLVELMGCDVIIQAGGGVHGHPQGTRNGAVAMRQAVDAVMENISLQEYAGSHPELKAALEKWTSS
ncbi:MAG: type III ribulose-bisphosphate carboxylase [Candidatus Altiarchaeota archaeon]|nr:type III ribulose-bisphosphate carboxylase [Candidatus Altiarchaeota archaeon]